MSRPFHLTLNGSHPLANGLVFAGLAPQGLVGSTLYPDASIRKNNGTLTSMDPATDWIWDASLDRLILDLLHTSSQYVPIPGNDYATPRSMACWCKLPAAGASRYFLSDYNSSANNDSLSFNISATNDLRIVCANGIVFTQSWTCTNWNHVLAVRDTYSPGNYIALSLNGGTFTTSTQPTPGGGVYPGANITIGRAGDYAGLYATVQIADLMIWNRMLSQAEASLLADPSNVMLSGLVLPRRRRLFSGAAGGPAAIDCEIAQTLPKLGQSAAADVDISASVAQTLPKLAQSATADVDLSASAAQTLPKLAQSATADVDVSASATQTLPLLAQSVAAAVEVAAAINQTLPKLAQAGNVTTAFGFTGAQTLPKLGQSATADVDVSASADQALPKLGQSVAADVDVSASAAQTLPKLAQAGNLLKPSGLVGAQTLPKLSQSATADVDVSASAAQTLPKLQQRAQVGETPTAAARTFIVLPRTSTFIVT